MHRIIKHNYPTVSTLNTRPSNTLPIHRRFASIRALLPPGCQHPPTLPLQNSYTTASQSLEDSPDLPPRRLTPRIYLEQNQPWFQSRFRPQFTQDPPGPVQYTNSLGTPRASAGISADRSRGRTSQRTPR